jgi:hypothetical protein
MRKVQGKDTHADAVDGCSHVSLGFRVSGLGFSSRKHLSLNPKP